MKHSVLSIYGLLFGLSIFFFSSCDSDKPCSELAWYEDADGDGLGNPNTSKTSCEQPEGFVADNSDTDDSGDSDTSDLDDTDPIDPDPNDIDPVSTIPAELQSFTLVSIFEDNFDTQDDFANGIGSPNNNGTAAAFCRNGSESACATMPRGWDVLSSGERFHPDIISNESAQAGVQINDFEPRGGTGKSMVIWDESYGTGSQWGSDALLGKRFSPGYDDIYAEMWVKFQPNYRWQYMETTKGINYAKILRMSHSDSDPISTGGDGTNAPMTILDIKVWSDNFFDGPRTNRVALQGQVRCDPQETNYQCPGRGFGLTGNISVPGVPGINGDASFLDSFGNGEWHKIGMRMALNSAPGAEDGILMIWYDDELVSSSSVVTFLETGAPESHLITTVLLGGNMNNVVEAEANQFEQWYAIDDVRIFAVQ